MGVVASGACAINTSSFTTVGEVNFVRFQPGLVFFTFAGIGGGGGGGGRGGGGAISTSLSLKRAGGAVTIFFTTGGFGGGGGGFLSCPCAAITMQTRQAGSNRFCFI